MDCKTFFLTEIASQKTWSAENVDICNSSHAFVVLLVVTPETSLPSLTLRLDTRSRSRPLFKDHSCVLQSKILPTKRTVARLIIKIMKVNCKSKLISWQNVKKSKLPFWWNFESFGYYFSKHGSTTSFRRCLSTYNVSDRTPSLKWGNLKENVPNNERCLSQADQSWVRPYYFIFRWLSVFQLPF